MRKIKRAVHLDFHTQLEIPDFGQHFDARQFAETLKAAHVDFVTVFAKCNNGFAYYTTDIGIRHPHMQFDMLGEMVAECHKQGIGVAAYFNVGLDHEMARKHREWCLVGADGHIMEGDRTGNFFRLMCLNSGYREYLLSMIKEVCDRYPVDGIFLDCIMVTPCHGNECNEGMLKLGMNPLNSKDAAQFTKQHAIQLFEEIKEVIGEDKLFFPNGLGHLNAQHMSTHIEVECLPGAWSYDYFAAQAAFSRQFGKHTVYMTGRFHASWGDFGGLKSKASLEYDCWDAISNGMAVSVGDHMHPRDGLDQDVYEMIGAVYGDIERYEPWSDDTSVVTDIAIIMPPGSDMGANNVTFLQGQAILSAAARMLGELKCTYDIRDENADLSGYKVIILPDFIVVSPSLQQKLTAHLASGGGIISSGHSGLNEARTAFAMDDWNMDYEGADPWNISYFKMHETTERLNDRRLYAIYNHGIKMKGREGSQDIAAYYQPYFNKEWDGFHSKFYTPPDKDAGWPAVLRSQRIFQISFLLFTGYSDYAMPEHKYLLQHCLQQLLPEPAIRYEQLPSTSRVMLTSKDQMEIVHIKVTYPELRGKYNVIEEHAEVSGGIIYVRGEGVRQVYRAPDRQALAYSEENGYVRIELPKIHGYMMIVIER